MTGLWVEMPLEVRAPCAEPSGRVRDDVTEETIFPQSFKGQLGNHQVNRVRMTFKPCTSVKKQLTRLESRQRPEGKGSWTPGQGAETIACQHRTATQGIHDYLSISLATRTDHPKILLQLCVRGPTRDTFFVLCITGINPN